MPASAVMLSAFAEDSGPPLSSLGFSGPRSYTSSREPSLNLDDDASVRSGSVGHGRRAATIAQLYRQSVKSTPDMWRTSSVADTVLGRHSIDVLRELCVDRESAPLSGCDLVIDADRLVHVKKLGTGAYAEVSIAEFRGRAGTDPPQLVAVKQLKTDTMRSESDVLDFIEEVRVMHRLNDHPNIVNFIGFGALDTTTRESEWRTIFLVQEYCGGGTIKNAILKQMVDRQKTVYTHATALRWAINMADGLAAMHASSPMVIHRDLKAENVLLTGLGPESRAKIGDLGLHAAVNAASGLADTGAPGEAAYKPGKIYAEVVEESPCEGQDVSVRSGTMYMGRWKMTGVTGSYCYMAPEVLNGQPYNERVDVFSLGVILYEIFTKHFVGAAYLNTAEWDESELHARQVAAGWRPSFPASMPAQLRALIDECWAGVPQLRPSMAEVAHRLRAIQDSGVAEEMDDRAAQAKGCACAIM